MYPTLPGSDEGGDLSLTMSPFVPLLPKRPIAAPKKITTSVYFQAPFMLEGNTMVQFAYSSPPPPAAIYDPPSSINHHRGTTSLTSVQESKLYSCPNWLLAYSCIILFIVIIVFLALFEVFFTVLRDLK